MGLDLRWRRHPHGPSLMPRRGNRRRRTMGPEQGVRPCGSDRMPRPGPALPRTSDLQYFHPRGLRFAWYFATVHNHCISFGDRAPFHCFRFTIDFLRLRIRCGSHACGLSSPTVNISRKLLWSENPIFCTVNAPMIRFLLQVEGKVSFSWKNNHCSSVPNASRNAVSLNPRTRDATLNRIAVTSFMRNAR